MDRDVIDKVLSKVATEDEARKVANWFKTNEGQEYLSFRIDKEVENINDRHINDWLDHEVPRQDMRDRFLSQLGSKKRFRVRYAAAAIIPLFILLGSLLLVINSASIFSNKEFAEVTVPYGEKLHIILHDGTSVQLNSGSTLQYPKTFGIFRRNVKLSGEAYFSVSKDRVRSFMVDVEDISVHVTGTKFNVKAYQDERVISVTLEEGSVDIKDKNDNVYPVSKGQDATFDKETGICTVTTLEDLTERIAWLGGAINFYRTPLINIINTLERQYDVQIVVNDSSVLDDRFSISSKSNKVEDIFRELEVVSNISFESKGDNIYLLVTVR